MKLSIVSTLYMSHRTIDDFYARISTCAQRITDSYQIIFVDDGSPDASRDKARAICDKDPRVMLVELSRNFGHHKAIMTGLSVAEGEHVFLIDSDLEEAPELLLEFWDTFRSHNGKVDLLFGVQRKRKGGWVERNIGSLFYYIFNALSDFKLPHNLLVVRMMSSRYVKTLVRFKEHDLLFAGVSGLAGYEQRPHFVDKGHKNSTSYSLGKKLNLILNSITSFSALPLVLIFYLGCVITIGSVLLTAFLAYRKYVMGISLEGWTSVIVSELFFGGLILFCLGVIGVYLSKIFVQVKDRPFTIISEIYQKAALTDQPVHEPVISSASTAETASVR